MRSFALAAAIAALVPSCADRDAETTATHAAEASAEVEALLTRTQEVVDLAARAALEHRAAADKLRGAWMRQEAAKHESERDEPTQAAKLSLQARRQALKVLRANNVPVAAELGAEQPAEKALAARAQQGRHDEIMEQAELRTPPPEEFLGPASPSPEQVRELATRLLERSQSVLAAAQRATREGGEERSKFRNAWIRQRAGWDALRGGALPMAAKLGLQARKLAFKVIEGNGGTADPALFTTFAEKGLERIVEDSPDPEFDRRVAAVEAQTPPVEELLSAPLPEAQ
jgi:hypothetical protein